MAWGIREEKIKVIYNAVPIESLGVVPEEVKKLPRPLIVTAGRLVPWKNMDGVIDAVSEISGASLAIVGEGPEHAALVRRAENKLHGRAVFTGRLSHKDTLAVVKFSDVFVLNSSYEGLSHLLIEACLLNVPIVATDAGGNSEVVNDKNGTLIPVGDTKALICAIQEIKQPTKEKDLRFAVETMLSKVADVLTHL